MIDNKIYNMARDAHDKGNYKNAFELYQKGVKAGDVRCNYGVALFFKSDYYVKEDKEKANEIFTLVFPYIKSLAEHGDSIACCIIGFYYFNGFAVEENESEAVRWFAKSAEQGYAAAQLNLGYCYDKGEGLEEDKVEAVKWYTKSAEQGNAMAQYNLGNCYYYGRGVEEDKTEALKWYTKAAVQGDAKAQYNLGNCYRKGEGIEENKTEAVMWYMKAAEQGDADAQFCLGNCYYWGDGIEENKEEAVKWYRKAAEQGDASAQDNLGTCYYNGECLEKDKAEAVKWYTKAAMQGDASAQLNLGDCYYFGDGIEENKTEAVKWYTKAAEQGNSTAQFNLGYYYDDGEGVEEDKAEAVKWYIKSAEQGEASAQYNLALCYANGKGIEEDKDEAVKWYKKAAEQGEANAQFNLGNAYRTGEGIKKDKVEAAKWYTKAAEQGDVKAQFNLALCCDNGDGVEENKAEAVKWYRKAAEQGDVKAQNNLGYCYSKGIGIEQDGKKALDLFNTALRTLRTQGEKDDELSGDIYQSIASLYDENLPYCKGVYKDNFKAKEYYEKAVGCGNDCKTDLKTLEALMKIDDSEANRMGEFVKEIESNRTELKSLYGVVEERLKKEFGVVWNKLQKATRECLITGCITYVSLVSTGEENYMHMDFSSAIVPMTKACEIEFGRIFFDKFLAYLQKNSIPPTEFDPEKQKFVVDDGNKPEEYGSDEKYIYYRMDKVVDKDAYSYVALDKTGVFTLGGIDKYAGINKSPCSEPAMQKAEYKYGRNGIEENKRATQYQRYRTVINVDKHFLAFMDGVFANDAFSDGNREENMKKYLYSLSTRVRDMAFKLRNPSSHTIVMPFWKALYCANMVIMVDRILSDFISKLKPEYVTQDEKA